MEYNKNKLVIPKIEIKKENNTKFELIIT